jgi:hypothetical protein
MRTLTPTLLAAQKDASHVPYIEVEAKGTVTGVVRLDWERLYTGSEDDYFHALSMPGDGSMVRVRITPVADGRKLYRQRVPDPGPLSDFSSWTYTNQYNCVAVAAASLGSEVSVFWMNSSRELRRIKSTDYGVGWGSPELIDYSPSTAINGLSAAYKSNGDLAIFFADQATLYVKKHVGGSWQEKAAWDETTGDLSGVAVFYDDDWNLLVTGKNSSANFKLWSLVYGDGGDVASGTWSDLKELASAPSDSSFEYHRVFMDKPDVYRCFFAEKFTGSQEYKRPFWSHSIPDSGFLDNLWREPVPFDLSSDYGLAMAHHGSYCWLSAPYGIWRAGLALESLDLTDDVISLRQELVETRGRVLVELRNDDGSYGSLPPPLDAGCQLEVSPGYVTSQGNEVSSGQSFILEDCEYISRQGKSSLMLSAWDGWHEINTWRARHQFRWNKSSNEMNVRQILEFVLARAGLKLETKSQSPVITSFYPDFTIHPGRSGLDIIRRLLSFAPDVIFVEGSKAYLVNPSSGDASEYSYGVSHPLVEGKYRSGGWELNRVQVEGYDPVSQEPIVADSFSWDQVGRFYDRLSRLEDSNIDTVNKAEERGLAYLRNAELASASGAIRVPVNCGQQLYDVVDITDNCWVLTSSMMPIRGTTSSGYCWERFSLE